ncbi:putative bifunctional diguanylate cyclase/phosphodiesterase [Oceanospirillum sediminis]|uniref:cyclic-guanylate-specific phosphodiesterase n=1 Tax=Oceanospirillum sediminis TaxID=2760088 RepID=A0A839IPN3_9GAMM|nr:EAL domain-containing protein [Oceanospirillum sediminis]MBB1487215.1 EAL domain-containing protein [Oceanospirillum sediminis]
MKINIRAVWPVLIPVTVILVLLLFALSSFSRHSDLFFYDTWMGSAERPARDDIVIIGIDDKSINELGRWPWSRAQHARLLDNLTEAGARIIGMDMIFSEPESPAADQALAWAIRTHGRVVLALAPEKTGVGDQMRELLPLTDFAIAAGAMGHVHVDLDEDGHARKVFLQAGLESPQWPLFALAVAQQLGYEIRLSEVSYLQMQYEEALEAFTGKTTGWVRVQPVFIPFAGGDQHFKHFSYVDVLNDRVPEGAFQGKIVLVGATATGLSDILSTPRQRMAGVEFNANIVQALLEERQILPLSPYHCLLLMLAMGVFSLLVLWQLASRFLYLLFLPLLLMPLAISWLLFSVSQIWFAPVNAVLMQAGIFLCAAWWQAFKARRKISTLNDQVYQQLNFDTLTHLPNRNMLSQQISEEITRAPDSRFALVLIQPGGLKSINDRFGLQAGDLVLLNIAHQIKTAVSHSHPVARPGGLEFSVLICQQNSTDEIRHIASRLIALLQQPCEVNGESIYLTPSIGISIYPDDGRETEVLIGNAYTAMHKAKTDSRSDVCFYSRQLKQQIEHTGSLERDLRKALPNREFQLYYQPQVCSDEGDVIGLEALIRWHHPVRGMVSPGEFIPLAEKTGLILGIGDWVLEEACRQAASWRGQGLNIRMAVNISALQFNHTLVDKVRTALDVNQLPPDSLELEITESALVNDLSETRDTLVELKALGVQIALDDFGTGYSSLSYLKTFPLDRLKIDQSFVRDLTTNTESADIALAIINMAHSLNLKVIAEGVETQEQQKFLQGQTCEELQGYLFSKPLPPDEIVSVLMARNSGQ